VIPLGASCDTTTQIAVEIVDSTGNEKVALNSILVKTQANQPDIIVGPLTSGEVVPMALTASVLEIPIIAYAATSQKLDDSTQ
jgi:ABC-type branched-subunit amino acid transport system substrate-binding protein